MGKIKITELEKMWFNRQFTHEERTKALEGIDVSYYIETKRALCLFMGQVIRHIGVNRADELDAMINELEEETYNTINMWLKRRGRNKDLIRDELKEIKKIIDILKERRTYEFTKVPSHGKLSTKTTRYYFLLEVIITKIEFTDKCDTTMVCMVSEEMMWIDPPILKFD